MSIVLLVLKILGIFLLVVLGVVILVCLSLLLVPVRYQAGGRIGEGMDFSVHVSWLLHMISFQIKYGSKGQEQVLRIFGIPLHLFQKEDGGKHQKSEKKKRKKEKKLRPKEKQSHGQGDRQLPEQTFSRESENPPGETNSPLPEQAISQEPETVRGPAAAPEKRIPSAFGKIKRIPGMIRAKWETLKEIIKGFWEKLSHFKEQAGRIREEIAREENLKALKALFEELKRLLRHILPRKIQGDLSFGTTDPSTTGQILGILSTMPFLYRYKIQLLPDFSSESYYIRGTFRLKGHARGIHAVISCFSLFRDKNIRKIIQRYRHS